MERETANSPQPDADFGRLFVQHERHLYGFIRTMVPSRTDAEDVLQETASVLWKKFDEYEAGTNFFAWAVTVARFQVMYFRRKQGRSKVFVSDAAIEAVAEETISMGDELATMRGRLEGCLKKLKAADRQLLRQRYAAEGTTRKLARELGRPESSVYNALNRIRRVLAECVRRQLMMEERS